MNLTVDNIRNGGLDFVMMAMAHAKYGLYSTLPTTMDFTSTKSLTKDV